MTRPGAGDLRRGPNRPAAWIAATVTALSLLGAATGWAALHHPTAPAASTPAAATPAATSTIAGAATTTTTTAPIGWTSTTVAMTYGGVRRSYLLLVPRGAPGPLPLIVDLSGSAVSASYEASRMDWQGVSADAVIVFPADTGQTWDAGHCCGSAASSHVDDVGFVEAVTARVLSSVAAADPARVYLAGYSNGGKLALDLACQDPDRWKAVAVYGATDTAACSARPALSLQVSAASGDPELTIGPGGAPHTVDGFVEPTVAAEVASARAAASCPATGSITTAGTLTTTVWSCAGGRRVALALYAGGSHTWPERSGDTPGETEVMWRWFVSLGA